LVSPGPKKPVVQGGPQDPPPPPPLEPTQTTQSPKKTPPQPINNDAFEIRNPEPGDVWTSGVLETISWEDLDLPAHVTYDISLIPEDPVLNPKALLLTRRPILRYVEAPDRFLDIVAPYDLISQEQLLKVQESGANYTWAESTTPLMDSESVAADPMAAPESESVSTIPTSPPSVAPVIETRVRLYITAYVGRTNKMIAQKSVYPLIIRKDPELDRREPQPNLPIMPEWSLSPESEEIDAGHPEDGMLEKKDSILAHLEDLAIEGDEHQTPESDNVVTSEADETTGENLGVHLPVHDSDDDAEMEMDESEEGHHHHHTFGDWVTENFDDEFEESDEEKSIEEVDELEQENTLNAFTPTSDETGENVDPSNQQEQAEDGHSHTHGGESSEDESEEGGEEGHGGHGHTHVMDPNHFQNDEDIAIWEEHIDDPGYNPPIRIEQAGTINITHWIENKERFFVGAPYVMAWSFPTESEGLTGSVNIYIEDAETAQRYDIVAGNLPSDVQFIYLRPSALLVSAIPKKKIFVRARVELDLFWAGTIQRYTGLSKTFYVERGAL